MYKFNEQDARVLQEIHLRFDEFISEPEKTDIWCPRCQTYVEQGRAPTQAMVVAARCKCRTEVMLVSKYEKLNQDDWDRICDAI
jgi:hypothetical protein